MPLVLAVAPMVFGIAFILLGFDTGYFGVWLMCSLQ